MAGGELYVRAYRGAQSGWYRAACERGHGRIRVGAVARDVLLQIPAEIEPADAIDAAHHPRSENYFVLRSFDLLAQFNAFDLIRLISPRPLLMIADTEAASAYFSQEAIEEAQQPKELWIDGATHVDLYDKEEYLPRPGPGHPDGYRSPSRGWPTSSGPIWAGRSRTTATTTARTAAASVRRAISRRSRLDPVRRGFPPSYTLLGPAEWRLRYVRPSLG